MTDLSVGLSLHQNLYNIKDEYIIQNVIAAAGLSVDYPPLSEKLNVSPKTRIQAFRPAIEKAYMALDDDQKGLFAQNTVKQLLKQSTPGRKAQLEEALDDTGWALVDGELRTQDAMISEQFFPPGTPYDAYVAIRSILEQVASSLIVVDGYIGESLLQTLRRIADRSLHIRVLTLAKWLPSDFSVEALKFRSQLPKCQLEVRTTNGFHDRFIVADGTRCFHVGASIKDAGRRAFLVSRLEDQAIIDLLKGQIESTWSSAQNVP